MKPFKILLILATLWMAGSSTIWAAVGDTFSATNTDGVNINYKVLTEDGATGTVQVGVDYYTQAIPVTKWMEIEGENHEVFDIPEGELVIPQTVSNAGITYTVTSIGDYAFYEKGKTLTAISIPSTVTEIGESAFAYSRIQSVTLPDVLTSIGSDAFFKCTALQAIDIPQSVSTIGTSCFSSCNQLASVTLHAGNLTQLASYAFDGCVITSIDIPAGVTIIGGGAFYECSSLQSVTLPDGLTSIGYSAFSGCTALQALDIPSSVSQLGQDFVKDCAQLSTVTLHEGNLTEIGNYAFEKSGITSITIPEGVTKIGESAFRDCPSLQKANLPSSIKSLAIYAFYNCSVLSEVTIASDEAPSLPYRSEWVFTKGGTTKVDVLYTPWGSNFHAGFKSLFARAAEIPLVGCRITVDDRNYRILTLPDGDTDGTVELGAGHSYPGYSYDVYGEMTIADRITFTKDDVAYAFNVTTLGEGSFTNAYELGGITIPAAITLIKKEAIYECKNLERVYVKAESPCALEEDAFSGIKANCMLVVPTGCTAAYQNSPWGSVFTKIRELGNEIEWPQLAENQTNENEYNTCEALTKVTRWIPNSYLYDEAHMWDMPHMMDGLFYVSAFWQSNNSAYQSESFHYDNYTGNEGEYLQLTYNPAYLSPNYGSLYDNGGTASGFHDDQPGSTVGGFICFKVKGPGTIIVRGYTESKNAYIGICVQGNEPTYFSGTNDREVSYSYSLESEDTEAYAFVYGANLSPVGRHGYVRYVKFLPGGVVNADVSVGGIAIAEESNDVLGDGGSIGFEWREYEDGEGGEGGENPEGSRRLAPDNRQDDEGEGTTGTTTRYPVLILNDATLTSDNGPAIEVNSHDRFLIELRGQNTIQAGSGSAAISMGTLLSENWGGGTISIVGLEEGASLTIPATEGVENGIYLAESSIHMENFTADISGSDYGIRFQGFDPYGWENEANCNLTLGKGMSLNMRGGQEAISGFNPMYMDDLGYFDDSDEWMNYELLESDLEDAQPLWSGVYGVEEQEWVENPDNSDEGYWEYTYTPAKYLSFGIPPTEVTVNVGTYGMATFCSNYDLNFTDIDNVKAYIVSGFDGINTLTLTRVYEVPAGTGLVLYSTNGSAATATVPIEYAYSYYEQMLVGCTVDKYIAPTTTITVTEDGESEDYTYTNFVMSVKNGEAGFYRFNVDDSGKRKVEKGKAYLRLKDYTIPAGGGEARALSVRFEDDDTATTGISDSKRVTTDDSRYYNLNGQQVDAPQKGLYIKNGKKIVVK